MALAVASLHFEAQYGYPNFKTCYLAVEFFFVLSGFFLMKHLSAIPEDKIDVATVSLACFVKKFKRFFVLNFLCIVILHTWLFFINGGGSVIGYCNSFFDRLGECFFLQCSGLSLQLVNLPGWYLSSLLLGCYVITVNYCLNRISFQYIVAPAFVCFFYAFISQTSGKLDIWSNSAFGFLNYGLIRGLAGLCVGCLLYVFSENVKQKYSIKYKIPPNLFVLLDLANLFVMYKLLIHRNPSQTDFIVIPCFCITILLSYYRVGLSSKFTALKPFKFLGSISLELYLCHWFILDVINKSLSDLSYVPKIIIFLSVSVLYAFLFKFIVKISSKFFNKIAITYFIKQSA